MHLRRILPAALALALVAAAPAAAKLQATTLNLLRAPVASTGAVKRTCTDKALRPGAPGAVVRTITVPMGGMLDARLNGSATGGDWDLAVFNAVTGRMLNGSATFGANEVVQTAVMPGDVLTVQACRRTANAKPVTLTVRDTVVSGVAPAPKQLQLVRIPIAGPKQVQRLSDMGVDLNHGARGKFVDAVLYGRADVNRVRRAGFSYKVRIPDLIAYDRKHVRTSFDPISDQLPSGLPSGRRLYRQLIDYQNDLKAIAEANPTFVRPATLPKKSIDGRTIEGIEMAYDVNRTDDGRPTHVEMGMHHVREWPSGEVTIEYGFTLATGAGKSERIDKLLADSRTFVFPVINPDGTEAAMAGVASIPVYDDNGFTSLPLAVVGAGPYRRKNCRDTQGGLEQLPCAFRDGIDLNRNYGAFWGGPGSGAAPGVLGQTYRGEAPFSEPEAEAVHQWSSDHHVMVINSNHTYAGDFLFQPGFGRDRAPGLPYAANSKPVGTQVPNQAQMKELSDAMAKAAGYVSMVSYDLYDVTGATEDWNYFAQSAFGYTAEVAWEDFHPNYQDGVIDQYIGTVDGPMGQAVGREPSKGLQESFLLAGEAALNTDYHAVIEGDAPPGATLMLTKDFTTATYYTSGTNFIKIPEHLETTLTVPASGHYVWHVNPSSRPVALLAHQQETYTLTCGGQSTQVAVEMGQRVTQNLSC